MPRCERGEDEEEVQGTCSDRGELFRPEAPNNRPRQERNPTWMDRDAFRSSSAALLLHLLLTAHALTEQFQDRSNIVDNQRRAAPSERCYTLQTFPCERCCSGSRNPSIE